MPLRNIVPSATTLSPVPENAKKPTGRCIGEFAVALPAVDLDRRDMSALATMREPAVVIATLLSTI